MLSAHFFRKPAFTATSSPSTTYCETPPLRAATSVDHKVQSAQWGESMCMAMAGSIGWPPHVGTAGLRIVVHCASTPAAQHASRQHSRSSQQRHADNAQLQRGSKPVCCRSQVHSGASCASRHSPGNAPPTIQEGAVHAVADAEHVAGGAAGCCWLLQGRCGLSAARHQITQRLQWQVIHGRLIPQDSQGTHHTKL